MSQKKLQLDSSALTSQDKAAPWKAPSDSIMSFALKIHHLTSRSERFLKNTLADVFSSVFFLWPLTFLSTLGKYSGTLVSREGIHDDSQQIFLV